MSNNDKNIAGIILNLLNYPDRADSPAMLKIGDSTFLQAITLVMRDCGSSPTIALTNAANPIIGEAERLGIISVVDDSGKKGEIPGLKKVLAQYREELLGALITPVTYPKVSRNVYMLLCHVFQENPDRIIIPIFNGKRGFPVILPETVIDDIIFSTNILYLDDLLRAHSSMIFEQLVSDPEICREYRYSV